MTRSQQMKLIPGIAIWISCARLYALQTSPVLFRLKNGDGTDTAVTAGLVIMVFGLCLEGAADTRKISGRTAITVRIRNTQNTSVLFRSWSRLFPFTM